MHCEVEVYVRIVKPASSHMSSEDREEWYCNGQRIRNPFGSCEDTQSEPRGAEISARPTHPKLTQIIGLHRSRRSEVGSTSEESGVEHGICAQGICKEGSQAPGEAAGAKDRAQERAQRQGEEGVRRDRQSLGTIPGGAKEGGGLLEVVTSLCDRMESCEDNIALANKNLRSLMLCIQNWEVYP